MTAQHGGGLLVVAEGREALKDAYVVHDLLGRLPADVASFDFENGIINILAKDPAPGQPKTALKQTKLPYDRYFGSMPSIDLVDDRVLADLGEALRFNGSYAEDESTTPVAYTYLGQFIFHDITAMVVPASVGAKPFNRRTASLDLDSVLGEANPSLVGPATQMTVGTTAAHGRPYDLPRGKDGMAVIADLRSDDNLPLAQTHMAVIRFFNAIVSAIPGITNVAARALAVSHFQSVVLHDYLKRVIDRDVYDDVLSKGRAVIHVGARQQARAGQPFPYLIPLEFAAACARFGHSMIRNNYFDWNASNANARLTGFWSNTYNSCVPPLDGTPAEPRTQLSDRWVAQWGKLLDGRGLAHGQAPLMAAKIDTTLADPLKTIPDAALPEPTISLGSSPQRNVATLSLLRGRSLQLSSAQTVAHIILPMLAARSSPDFPILTPEQLRRDEPVEVKNLLGHRHPGSDHDFLSSTPLWFYTLREAAVLNGGQRLGPLGSRIVMETVHAAIEQSSTSILDGAAWLPDPRLNPSAPDKYTFPDLIAFAGLYNT